MDPNGPQQTPSDPNIPQRTPADPNISQQTPTDPNKPQLTGGVVTVVTLVQEYKINQVYPRSSECWLILKDIGKTLWILVNLS